MINRILPWSGKCPYQRDLICDSCIEFNFILYSLKLFVLISVLKRFFNWLKLVFEMCIQ